MVLKFKQSINKQTLTKKEQKLNILRNHFIKN